VYIENLTELKTINFKEIMDLLVKGAKNRHVGAT
jgi:hypothetical protein